MALPNDIIRVIDDLRRRLHALETNPQPPNINLGQSVAATFDLLAGDWVLITLTLTDSQGGRLISQPNFSLFRSDAADTDALYPTGADWIDAEVVGLRLHWWFDWATTNNNNVVVKVLLVNDTASDFLDLYFAANFRFLTKGVSVA